MLELDIEGSKRPSIRYDDVINGRDLRGCDRIRQDMRRVSTSRSELIRRISKTHLDSYSMGEDWRGRCLYAPCAGDYGFIVFARDDLSGWMEGRAIDAVNSWNVAKFIYEDVLCRHGCPLRIIMNEDTENLDLTKGLLEHYRIQQTFISAYHPQANGLVERGHDSIVNSLAKHSKEPGDWMKFLRLALWADRISVRCSTDYSIFELVHGRELQGRDTERAPVLTRESGTRYVSDAKPVWQDVFKAARYPVER